jgi:hypothetical protein
MPEISMLRYDPRNIQIIDKTEYYKIKYVGEHTFLNLLVRVPQMETTIDYERGYLQMILQDSESSRLLRGIDEYFANVIPNYRRFSEIFGAKTRIVFSLNRFVIDFHNRGQTWAHLRFKCVRKITNDYNQVLLYIV